MRKMFLATALAVSMCAPVYANFDDNSDASIYATPVYDEDANSASVVKKSAREENLGKAVPVKLIADQAEYDSVSGDFHLSGNVVITQGAEKLLTTHAFGNMKTGDIWLEEGGTLVEAGTEMTGKWVHYNFNTKTGEIKELVGKGPKEWYDAPHATILPDKIIVDEGGYMSRCPAKEHPPCLSVQAKTFEVYPKDKIVAHDVKVFVRGKHIYSRDVWVNEFDSRKTSIMPRVGYAGSDNGTFIKVDASWQFDEKTSANAELVRYKKAGYKPMYSLRHNERNFDITYKNGWEEDDDVWYKKQNNWKFRYKPHHFIDGLPLSYSGYFEYGLWEREGKRSNRRSWHKEYAVYLSHDPIYLFNSKNTVLNLRIGRKWVNESYTGETEQTDIYSATLAQKLSKKWDTWVGWHREDETSSLFDIGQPDMAKEIRNGLRWKPDDKNTFTIINRYDVGKGHQYSTKYTWEHKFCCFTLAFEYEQEQHLNDSSRKIVYYFDNL